MCFGCLKDTVTNALNMDLLLAANGSGIKCAEVCENIYPYGKFFISLFNINNLVSIQRKLKNMGPDIDAKLSEKLTTMMLKNEGAKIDECPFCSFSFDLASVPLGGVLVECPVCIELFCK